MANKWVDSRPKNQRREWLQRGNRSFGLSRASGRRLAGLDRDCRGDEPKPESAALPPKNNCNRAVARRWWQLGADRNVLVFTQQLPGLERVLVDLTRRPVKRCLCIPTMQVVVLQPTLAVSLPVRHLRRLLRPPVPPPRDLGAFLRVNHWKDRSSLRPLRLFRDLPLPRRLGKPTRPSKPLAKAYYDFRADLMVRNDEGLTKTYNRFHDPDEDDPRHRQTPRPARRNGPGRPRCLWLERHPNRLSSFSLTTRSTRKSGASARSPTATAGPTTSGTTSLPASLN